MWTIIMETTSGERILNIFLDNLKNKLPSYFWVQDWFEYVATILIALESKQDNKCLSLLYFMICIFISITLKESSILI